MAARRTGQVIEWGEGKYRLRWYKGEANGKRRYSSEIVEAPSKREAEKVLRAKQGQVDRGEVVEPTRETVAEFLERWLTTAAAHKVRARSLADYRYMVEHYVVPKLGAIRVRALRTSDVQGLVGELAARVSPRTVRFAYRVLCAALGQAVKWQELPRNPAMGVDLPADTGREMRALSVEEVAKLRAALVGTRFAVLFDLALLTGMRPSEILGLRWQDVDLEAGTVSVAQVLSRARSRNGKPAPWAFTAPKTGKSRRTIPLLPELVDALRRHRAAQAAEVLRRPAYARTLDLVFATSVGQPLSVRDIVGRHFKPALRRAGLPKSVRLYDLRHTAASLLVASGLPINVVSELLGHASPVMVLKTYAHTFEGQRRQATERLGRLIFGA